MPPHKELNPSFAELAGVTSCGEHLQRKLLDLRAGDGEPQLRLRDSPGSQGPLLGHAESLILLLGLSACLLAGRDPVVEVGVGDTPVFDGFARGFAIGHVDFRVFDVFFRPVWHHELFGSSKSTIKLFPSTLSDASGRSLVMVSRRLKKDSAECACSDPMWPVGCYRGAPDVVLVQQATLPSLVQHKIGWSRHANCDEPT